MIELAVLLSIVGCQAEPRTIQIAAAANLSGAFEEMERAFERTSADEVSLVLGSSGLLARQIAEGAPYDLFASADVASTAIATEAGASDGRSRAVYARGRLALWWKAGPPLTALADVARPGIQKIAIASPDHAPYGRAARQALVKAGLWERVEPRLVHGEDVRQTLSFARSGNADVAFVPWSLAKAEPGGGRLALDPSLHEPIDQALVVCGRGESTEGGRRFADLVLSPAGQRILARHGYEPPP